MRLLSLIVEIRLGAGLYHQVRGSPFHEDRRARQGAVRDCVVPVALGAEFDDVLQNTCQQ